LDGDLTDKTWVKELLRITSPQYIFHCAASPLVKESADPDKFIQTNLLMTEYLLRETPKHCRFIYLSSATVYGNICKSEYDKPATERDVTNPTSVYGATKVACEALVQARHNLGRIDGLIVRLVANVGKGATHGILRDFIKKAKSDSDIFPILGESSSIKPFMHVSDTVSALIYLGIDKKATGIYNISAMDEVSTERIAQITMEILKVKKPVQFVGGNWEGDNQFVRVSPYKLHCARWNPKYWWSDRAIGRVVEEYNEQTR
jgi:UDP-glucose 4-epimerase